MSIIEKQKQTKRDKKTHAKMKLYTKNDDDEFMKMSIRLFVCLVWFIFIKKQKKKFVIMAQGNNGVCVCVRWGQVVIMIISGIRKFTKMPAIIIGVIFFLFCFAWNLVWFGVFFLFKIYDL